MNQTEILQNMTKGERVFKKDSRDTCRVIVKDGGIGESIAYYATGTSRLDEKAEEQVRANAQADASAVNNTYGKGINPESVERTNKALDRAEKLLNKFCNAIVDNGIDIFTVGDMETMDEIKEALTAAKL